MWVQGSKQLNAIVAKTGKTEHAKPAGRGIRNGTTETDEHKVQALCLKRCIKQMSTKYKHCLIELQCCPEPDIPANGRASTTNGLGVGQAIYYSCIQGMELVGQTKRICEAASTWSGTEPTCLIPVFPDILLAFGSILILLVIVDVFVVGVCVYYR
ncbi:hypothetical protein DPMN_078779 [Dreissena polymorpha]|uniref:Sushi domain-containing protein n=1 Tax=Dreissena polymorpha TaxID=45954 RepID=A0A9D3YR85_DREPO|nr:hypothetical protein DPMN_078779 [Dreissena polymorpha]